VVCVGVFGAATLLMHRSLRWRLAPTPALALTALFVAVPSLLRLASSGYADLPLILFYLGALHFLARWQTTGDGHDLVLGALFTAFAAFTKNEGLALAVWHGLVLAALARTRAHWRGVAAYAGLVLAVLLPYLLWRLPVPGHYENYAGRAISGVALANLGRLPLILMRFGAELLDWRHWGAVWLLVPAGLVLTPRAVGQAPGPFLYLAGVGHVGLYVCVYLLTPHDLASHLADSLERVLLHVVPAAVLIAGHHWWAAATPPELFSAGAPLPAAGPGAGPARP